jgi:hypothetical protein
MSLRPVRLIIFKIAIITTKLFKKISLYKKEDKSIRRESLFLQEDHEARYACTWARLIQA